MHDAIQMHLPISNKDMFSWLFHFGLKHDIAFIDSSNGFGHFGKFARNKRLDCYSNGGLRPKLKGENYVELVVLKFSVGDGCSFYDCLVDPFDKHEIASRDCIDFKSVPAL